MSAVEGKVVAVTGASSGIGEAIARLLAAEGAPVVLGARREDRLEALAGEIGAAGGSARWRKLDVTRRADVEAFVAFAQEAFGRLDVLVNNAGLMPLSPLSAQKQEEWDRMIDVNLRGVLHGIAAALPVMEAQGSGHIVNISSVAGHQVIPNGAVYCATKFAVRALSEGLRQETDKIRVTVVSPGATQSELAETITHEATRKRVEERRKSAIPADSVARAVLYAISQPPEVDTNEILIRPAAITR